MQRCDVCFEPSEKLKVLEKEFREQGLRHICLICDSEVSKACMLAFAQLNKLRIGIRKRIWKRFIKCKRLLMEKVK